MRSNPTHWDLSRYALSNCMQDASENTVPEAHWTTPRCSLLKLNKTKKRKNCHHKQGIIYLHSIIRAFKINIHHQQKQLLTPCSVLSLSLSQSLLLIVPSLPCCFPSVCGLLQQNAISESSIYNRSRQAKNLPVYQSPLLHTIAVQHLHTKNRQISDLRTASRRN